MRERLPLPARIANAPELWIGLELYYDAFLDLSSCRPVGFGLGPIPWSAIAEYAVVNRLDDDQRDDLFCFIAALDRAYLEYHHQKAERESKSRPDRRSK